MTQKVNQKVSPGFFFEQDITLLDIAIATTAAQWGNIAYDPVTGLLVPASDDVQKILDVVATRGTVIAISTDTTEATAGTYISLVIGHAGGEYVAADLLTAINATAPATAATAVVVGTKFRVS